MKTPLIPAGLFALAFGLVPNATPQSPLPRSPALIQLFSGTHFRGEAITLQAGQQLDDFNHIRFPSGRHANNRISSIRIGGEAEVTLFDYRGFTGESITLTRSVARLEDIPQKARGDWNNALSSITARPQRVLAPGDLRRPGRAYAAPNGSCSERGRPGSERGAHHQADRVTSHAFGRQTVRVVTRAYEDVLGRQPDANGLATYIRVLEKRGWSESQLRRELRRSPEYRTIVVPREINAAYRDILGRDPDPAGLSFYSAKMIRDEWTVSRVRDALRRSPEYASRGGDEAKQPRARKWG